MFIQCPFLLVYGHKTSTRWVFTKYWLAKFKVNYCSNIDLNFIFLHQWKVKMKWWKFGILLADVLWFRNLHNIYNQYWYYRVLCQIYVKHASLSIFSECKFCILSILSHYVTQKLVSYNTIELFWQEQDMIVVDQQTNIGGQIPGFRISSDN